MKKGSIFILLFLISQCLYSQNIKRDTVIKYVYVGIYLNQINEINLRNNTFTAEFYFWFRWDDNTMNPLKDFFIVNGKIDQWLDSATSPVRKANLNYAYGHVTCTFKKFWNVEKFPLDQHKISIGIESLYYYYHFRYIIDSMNIAIDPQVTIPGYTITSMEYESIPFTYHTNYGDNSISKEQASVFPRFIFSLNISRPNYGFLLKLFTGLILAFIISILTLFINPKDIDPRFGLAVGGVFAVVTSQYVIVSMLPDTNILTLADKFHIVTITIILLILIESTYSLKLVNRGEINLSKKIDKISFILLTLFYFSTLLILTFL